MQVLDALLPKEVGVHDIPVSCAGALTVRLPDAELPLNDAEICAVRLIEMLPTEAVKLPELWPAGIATAEGTVTLALLLAMVTVAPPPGAGADRVIVQPADPMAVIVLGEQFTEDGTTATVKLIPVDFCWLLYAPVTVAV